MFEQVEPNSERWFNLTPLKNETFKPIKNYEKLYAISNYGRVKSLERDSYHWNRFQYCTIHIKEKILKLSYDKDKYFICTLNSNGKSKWCRLHRLVAETFLENKNNYECINHKDGNKQNPRIDNLEWCTDYENKQHAKINGLVRKERKLILYNDLEEKEYNNVKEYAKKENISFDTANYYIYKKREWKGYKFRFVNDNN